MKDAYKLSNKTTSEILLEVENEISVHQKCIELIMIKVYKYLHT